MSSNRFWSEFEARANRVRDLPHHLKWFYQRVTRGYDDRDVWDFDDALVKFIYPRLKHFVKWQTEHGMSCPEDLDPAAWLEVLNKISTAFELMAKRTDLSGLEPDNKPPKAKPLTDQGLKEYYDALEVWIKEVAKEDEKIKEGMGLFGKYLLDLWD